MNYVVLGVAILFEASSFFVAFREFSVQKGRLGYVDAVHRGKNPLLFVVLFEDSAAMLGLVTAAVGITLIFHTPGIYRSRAAR